MPRNTEVIPRLPLARLLKKHGAARVSKEAADEFGKILTRIAEEISAEAAVLAEHSGRKTILGEDVELAAKRRRATRF